ncbi:permease-like cell division protein FtsX [Clostridium sp. C8-1-8]|uniref:permease-like cell division protein FtsX n=1 Tax=Clostridium sp. C8-1-8 TaxID=2698831 RepID=UPI00137188E7|nr:permease-like cell division protein FtsX [Clostridium sp. C8-1-8]
MKISTIKYFISDAFKSLRRNRTISIASMATVLATLFVFGVFMLAALNVNNAVNSVESKIQIQVYLNKDITLTDERDIEVKLRAVNGVKDVTFESKEEALEKFKKQLKDNASLLEGYDTKTNPLPDSYMVEIDKPENTQKVINEVKGMKGIEEIGNDQDLVNKIAAFSKTIRWVGVIIFVVLIGVSLFLIMNTIKLTVYSRRREVGIMKFVGATDWFIRWPFILEGVVIGVVGAVISNILLFFAYKEVYYKITAQLITANLINPNYVLTMMSWQFVISGALIGIFASIIALRKFLVV